MVPEGDDWTGNAVTAEVVTDPTYGARILHATFAEGEAEAGPRGGEPLPLARPRRGRRAAAVPLSDAERQLYLAATELMPTDGIVQGDRRQDHRRRRRRRGEGAGDLRLGGREHLARRRDARLRHRRRREHARSGNLGGKCADLNALYVALARASGLPARDLYGIRVAPSAFGYKSLGAKNGDDHQVAALPGRGLPRRPRLGRRSTRPTCARWCSRSRRATMRSTATWSSRRARSSSAPGRATGSLQRRPRPGAAGLGAQGRLPDVPAGRGRRRAPRLPRSGHLRLCDHGGGGDGLKAFRLGFRLKRLRSGSNLGFANVYRDLSWLEGGWKVAGKWLATF